MLRALENYQKHLTMNWNEDDWKKGSLSTRFTLSLEKKDKTKIGSAQGTFFVAHNDVWNPRKILRAQDFSDTIYGTIHAHHSIRITISCSRFYTAMPPVIENNHLPSLNLLLLKEKNSKKPH